MDNLSVILVKMWFIIGQEIVNIIAMKFGARIVFEALVELVEERGQQPVFYEEIANRANCSTKTVQRAIRDLREEGKLHAHGKGKRGGYSFEVVS